MTQIANVETPSATSRLFAGIAFAGALTALLALAALHVLKPDLDPTWHMISEYALGPLGWVMTLCFAAMSLGCAGLVAALAPYAGRPRLKIGLVALAAAALGLGMAAVYPMDPITVPPEQASLSGKMHGIAAMIGNPGFLAAALLLGFPLARRAPWATDGTRVAAMSHLVWIGFAVLTAAVIHLVATEPEMTGIGVIGLANRLLMAAYGFWLIALAWPVLCPRGRS